MLLLFEIFEPSFMHLALWHLPVLSSFAMPSLFIGLTLAYLMLVGVALKLQSLYRCLHLILWNGNPWVVWNPCTKQTNNLPDLIHASFLWFYSEFRHVYERNSHIPMTLRHTLNLTNQRLIFLHIIITRSQKYWAQDYLPLSVENNPSVMVRLQIW